MIPKSTVANLMFVAMLVLPLGLLTKLHGQTPTSPKKIGFVHPGIAHTVPAIAYVKVRLESSEQPWTAAWNDLQNSKYSQLSWKPRPRSHVARGSYGNPDFGASDFIRDGSAAYTHALKWALAGDQANARKAAEILNAWSHTLDRVTDHDAALLIGMCGHHYCNAAELLTHTWDSWPVEDQFLFEEMLREVWYPIIKDFYPSANGNWDASMLQTMMAMAVFLNDRTMFERAVNYYLEGKGNGAVRNYFNEFGQCQESGRDQTHTQMGLEFLANACEIAWNQGVDLYGAYDNRLLKGFEYTAKYNLGHEVPYEPYESYQGRYFYDSISTVSRGKFNPMYEKALNHYKNRKGLDTPFTEQVVAKTRPESRGGSILPWGTLMYANQPASFEESH